MAKSKSKRRGFKLLYVGTKKRMEDMKKTKGRFLPRSNYVVAKLPKSCPESRRPDRAYGLYRRRK